MRLKTNNKTYPDIRFHPTADGCVITAREAIAPGETMTIETNGGEVLRTYTAADWAAVRAPGLRADAVQYTGAGAVGTGRAGAGRA